MPLFGLAITNDDGLLGLNENYKHLSVIGYAKLVDRLNDNADDPPTIIRFYDSTKKTTNYIRIADFVRGVGKQLISYTVYDPEDRPIIKFKYDTSKKASYNKPWENNYKEPPPGWVGEKIMIPNVDRAFQKTFEGTNKLIYSFDTVSKNQFYVSKEVSGKLKTFNIGSGTSSMKFGKSSKNTSIKSIKDDIKYLS